MLNYIISEKRAARRVFTKVPLAYSYHDAETNKSVTKTVMIGDISETGLYFEHDEPLPLKQEAKVSFKLPGTDEIIRVMTKVMRVQATEDEKLFGVGVAFIELPVENQKQIKEYVERLDLRKLLQQTIDSKASDLHLLADHIPMVRVQGDLQELEMPKLRAEDIPRLIYSIMTKQQIRKFEQHKELDFGLQFDLKNRFRVNLHIQRGYLEATFRLIVTQEFSFQQLHIPDAVSDLARLKEGLILITGPTGSGKSTTIAAMVELINQEKKNVIITLERPIEYIYENKKSIIKQREIGIDTDSFSVALQSSLRQDPNVIIVGELDSRETVKTALMAAEAGYLVVASFHAPNTVSGIDRLTGLFPAENRKQILAQIANCLKGMVTQLLIPTKMKGTRVLASEIMIVSEAIKRIIRSDELYQIPNIIQTGAQYKMQSMQDAIRRYLISGVIDEETAHFYFQEFGIHTR